MFDLAHLRIVQWPVTLAQPGDDGEFVDVTLRVKFERLTKAELSKFQVAERTKVFDNLSAQLRKAAATAGLANEEAASDVDRDRSKVEDELAAAELKRYDLLMERVKGWGDQIIDRGTPVPFSREALSALLEIKPVFTAFWKGLFDASENARPKTSPPSPPGSPAEARS